MAILLFWPYGPGSWYWDSMLENKAGPHIPTHGFYWMRTCYFFWNYYVLRISRQWNGRVLLYNSHVIRNMLHGSRCRFTNCFSWDQNFKCSINSYKSVDDIITVSAQLSGIWPLIINQYIGVSLIEGFHSKSLENFESKYFQEWILPAVYCFIWW